MSGSAVTSTPLDVPRTEGPDFDITITVAARDHACRVRRTGGEALLTPSVGDGETDLVLTLPSAIVDGWCSRDASPSPTARPVITVDSQRGLLPPLDTHYLLDHPPNPAIEGLSFVAILKLNRGPLGDVAATLRFEAGRLDSIEDGLCLEEPELTATMSLRDWIEYREGHLRLDELFARGATVAADPKLLMFVGGYFDLPEVHGAILVDASAARFTLTDFGEWAHEVDAFPMIGAVLS